MRKLSTDENLAPKSWDIEKIKEKISKKLNVLAEEVKGSDPNQIKRKFSDKTDNDAISELGKELKQYFDKDFDECIQKINEKNYIEAFCNFMKMIVSSNEYVHVLAEKCGQELGGDEVIKCLSVGFLHKISKEQFLKIFDFIYFIENHVLVDEIKNGGFAYNFTLLKSAVFQNCYAFGDEKNANEKLLLKFDNELISHGNKKGKSLNERIAESEFASKILSNFKILESWAEMVELFLTIYPDILRNIKDHPKKLSGELETGFTAMKSLLSKKINQNDNLDEIKKNLASWQKDLTNGVYSVAAFDSFFRTDNRNFIISNLDKFKSILRKKGISEENIQLFFDCILYPDLNLLDKKIEQLERNHTKATINYNKIKSKSSDELIDSIDFNDRLKRRTEHDVNKSRKEESIDKQKIPESIKKSEILQLIAVTEEYVKQDCPDLTKKVNSTTIIQPHKEYDSFGSFAALGGMYHYSGVGFEEDYHKYETFYPRKTAISNNIENLFLGGVSGVLARGHVYPSPLFSVYSFNQSTTISGVGFSSPKEGCSTGKLDFENYFGSREFLNDPLWRKVSEKEKQFVGNDRSNVVLIEINEKESIDNLEDGYQFELMTDSIEKGQGLEKNKIYVKIQEETIVYRTHLMTACEKITNLTGNFPKDFPSLENVKEEIIAFLSKKMYACRTFKGILHDYPGSPILIKQGQNYQVYGKTTAGWRTSKIELSEDKLQELKFSSESSDFYPTDELYTKIFENKLHLHPNYIIRSKELGQLDKFGIYQLTAINQHNNEKRDIFVIQDIVDDCIPRIWTRNEIDTLVNVILKNKSENKIFGIHCAGGKGRTGEAALALSEILEIKLSNNLLETIDQLRKYRLGIIQTDEQVIAALVNKDLIADNYLAKLEWVKDNFPQIKTLDEAEKILAEVADFHLDNISTWKKNPAMYQEHARQVVKFKHDLNKCLIKEDIVKYDRDFIGLLDDFQKEQRNLLVLKNRLDTNLSLLERQCGEANRRLLDAKNSLACAQKFNDPDEYTWKSQVDILTKEVNDLNKSYLEVDSKNKITYEKSKRQFSENFDKKLANIADKKFTPLLNRLIFSCDQIQSDLLSDKFDNNIFLQHQGELSEILNNLFDSKKYDKRQTVTLTNLDDTMPIDIVPLVPQSNESKKIDCERFKYNRGFESVWNDVIKSNDLFRLYKHKQDFSALQRSASLGHHEAIKIMLVQAVQFALNSNDSENSNATGQFFNLYYKYSIRFPEFESDSNMSIFKQIKELFLVPNWRNGAIKINQLLDNIDPRLKALIGENNTSVNNNSSLASQNMGLNPRQEVYQIVKNYFPRSNQANDFKNLFNNIISDNAKILEPHFIEKYNKNIDAVFSGNNYKNDKAKCDELCYHFKMALIDLNLECKRLTAKFNNEEIKLDQIRSSLNSIGDSELFKNLYNGNYALVKSTFSDIISSIQNIKKDIELKSLKEKSANFSVSDFEQSSVSLHQSAQNNNWVSANPTQGKSPGILNPNISSTAKTLTSFQGVTNNNNVENPVSPKPLVPQRPAPGTFVNPNLKTGNVSSSQNISSGGEKPSRPPRSNLPVQSKVLGNDSPVTQNKVLPTVQKTGQDKTPELIDSLSKLKKVAPAMLKEEVKKIETWLETANVSEKFTKDNHMQSIKAAMESYAKFGSQTNKNKFESAIDAATSALSNLQELKV